MDRRETVNRAATWVVFPRAGLFLSACTSPQWFAGAIGEQLAMFEEQMDMTARISSVLGEA